MKLRMRSLISVAIALASASALAAGPDVTVINPASKPVPVTVQGTVPVTLQGSSSITGSVTVSNFPAVQKTRDVLAPGQSPITQSLQFNPSDSISMIPVTPQVPTGQRFIVLYVAATAFTGNNAFPVTAAACQLQFESGKYLAAFPLASTPLGLYWASENMFVVLNEGQQLGAVCRVVTGAPASQNIDMTVSGYFVSVQ